MNVVAQRQSGRTYFCSHNRSWCCTVSSLDDRQFQGWRTRWFWKELWSVDMIQHQDSCIRNDYFVLSVTTFTGCAVIACFTLSSWIHFPSKIVPRWLTQSSTVCRFSNADLGLWRQRYCPCSRHPPYGFFIHCSKTHFSEVSVWCAVVQSLLLGRSLNTTVSICPIGLDWPIGEVTPCQGCL